MTIELHIALTAGVSLRLIRTYIMRGHVLVNGLVITPEQGKEAYTGQEISVNNKGGNCLEDVNYVSS